MLVLECLSELGVIGLTHWGLVIISDAIVFHKTWSTLTQVMACCLTAPSHYLNHCWLIISKVFWHSPEGNFTRNAQGIYHWYELGNYLSKVSATSPRGHWVKSHSVKHRHPTLIWTWRWSPVRSIAVSHSSLYGPSCSFSWRGTRI